MDDTAFEHLQICRTSPWEGATLLKQDLKRILLFNKQNGSWSLYRFLSTMYLTHSRFRFSNISQIIEGVNALIYVFVSKRKKLHIRLHYMFNFV